MNDQTVPFIQWPSARGDFANRKGRLVRASHRTNGILFVTISLAVCCIAFSQQPTTPNQNATQTPTVRLSLIVTDRSNHAVDDLKKDEIQLVEDKIPQAIAVFARDERPVDYGLAIDASGSLRNSLGAMLTAARWIVNNKRDSDEVFLERFIDRDKIENTQEFTTEKTALVKSLDQINIEGGQSAVIDGVYLAVKHVAEHRFSPDRRHALILLTDGEDRQSYYTQGQLLQLLREKDVQVFAIGIVGQLDDWRGRTGLSQREKAEKLLSAVTQETGGRAFFPYKVDDLGQSFLDIGDELRHQYALAYSPAGRSADGKYHTIRIQTDRKDVIVRARKGYYSVPIPAPGKPAAPPA